MGAGWFTKAARAVGRRPVVTGAGWLARAAAVLAFAALPLAAADAATAAPVDGQVIGGHPVPDGKYPFLVLVEHKKFACTGTLVDPGWVLTAAHCAVNLRTGEGLPPRAYRVVVGRADLRERDEGRRVTVAEVVPHPGFDARSGEYDVALLRLAGPVASYEPVALVAAGDERFDRVGQTGTVTGWGLVRQEPPRVPDRAQEARVEVIGDRACGRVFNAITARMLCAAEAERTACYGDSGGPLLVNTPGGRLQIGVVSFGARTCGERGQVFARLSNPGIAAFIERTLAGG